MERTLIKGNKRLAEALGVHVKTVQAWRKQKVIAAGTVADYGRTIIYDLDKVLECLHNRPPHAGRRPRL